MLTMIKTIFFDVDNTLYEEKSSKVKAETAVILSIARKGRVPVEKVYREFEQSEEDIQKVYGGGANSNNRILWFQDLVRDLKVKLDPRKLAQLYWDNVLSDIRPYADVVAILPELSKEYELWILTDEFVNLQKRKLKHLGVSKYFKGIISSSHTGYLKPDKKLFIYALTQAKADKKTSVMIGDHPLRDIKGAKNAGIKSILLRRGKYYYYNLTPEITPDATIKSFFELQSVLKRL